MKPLFKILPWCFVALFASEIIAVMMPKRDGEFHVREFGRLPVLLNGRIQPLDSVARNSLLQIRSTGDVPLEEVPAWKFWHHPEKLKATPWLLELMTRPDVADTRPVFLIHHAELLGELKLQDKGIAKSGLRYYTFNQLRPVLEEVEKQGQKASEIDAAKQTTFQKQVLKLANAVTLYQRLKVTIQPEGADDFAQELAQFKKDLPAAQVAAKASEGGKDFDKDAIARMAQPLEDFRLMSQYGYPLIAPPLTQSMGRDRWQNGGAALLDSVRNDAIHPAMAYYAAMATAYAHNQPEEFNRAIADYQDWLAPRFGHEVSKARAEFYYNDVKAFLHATIIYICAFMLAGCAILATTLTPNLSEALRRSAFYLIILAGVVHTFGLIFRMALEGRPPVTNLYSSAIFIGWAAMIFGIIIERIYRVGLGSLVASLAGFITLLIAHNLALGGDTMEMLRAVLDTNFWLATHVVVVTLGYAATFFAGFLGILYIGLGLFTPLLSQKLKPAEAVAPGARSSSPARKSFASRQREQGTAEISVLAGPYVAAAITAEKAAGAAADRIAARESSITFGKALSKMVYGVVCFATLFSFIGTVLGGIWADQSWGRFWGWDPKENGALLIVIWNAIILHARWGGLVRDRGIMNLAVFGNIVTSFSWFGVNMLGIGLHSYGFMDAAFKWLMYFIGSQIFVIALGLIPLHLWRSFRTAAPAGISGRGTPTPQPAAG
jgi:cytochrome c-type biogenesis protein CcsB